MTTVSNTLPSLTNYSSGAAATPIVSKTSNSNLSQTAVALAATAGIVSTLNVGQATSPTYNAVGLLNSFVQAGQAGTSNSQQATAGAASPASPSLNANWSSALKQNPQLAAALTAQSMDQAILSTFSTTA